MAKAASTTTPVLPLFLMGAFCLPQAEEVEGFTAHLAENKLKTTNYKNTSKKMLPLIHKTGNINKRQPTSTLPLLAQRKHTTGGVIGTEVRMLSPPISHTFSMS